MRLGGKGDRHDGGEVVQCQTFLEVRPRESQASPAGENEKASVTRDDRATC